jgi:hypothetical protein
MTMSTRSLGILQWVGLLLGAGVWLGQHFVGYNVAEADCRPGSAHWGISNDLWQGVLMAAALALVAAAELSAIAVFRRTRGADYGDGPPEDDTRFGGALPYSRLHFFATASMLANVLFALIILLDGIATIANINCRQS